MAAKAKKTVMAKTLGDKPIVPLKPGNVQFQADATMRVLDTVYNKNNGQLTADAVLKEATPASSSIHHYFDWNDESAGHKFRLGQAALLIRRCHMMIMRTDTKTKRIGMSATRTFQHRSSQYGLGYEKTIDIMSDKNKRQELILNVLQQLDNLRAKYEDLEELAIVWKAVEKEIDKVDKKIKV